MFTLQNLNVVRIVASEREKNILLSQGFKLVVEEVKVKTIEHKLAEQEEVKEVPVKKSRKGVK